MIRWMNLDRILEHYANDFEMSSPVFGSDLPSSITGNLWIGLLANVSIAEPRGQRRHPENIEQDRPTTFAEDDGLSYATETLELEKENTMMTHPECSTTWWSK